MSDVQQVFERVVVAEAAIARSVTDMVTHGGYEALGSGVVAKTGQLGTSVTVNNIVRQGPGRYAWTQHTTLFPAFVARALAENIQKGS